MGRIECSSNRFPCNRNSDSADKCYNLNFTLIAICLKFFWAHMHESLEAYLGAFCVVHHPQSSGLLIFG